MNYKVILGFLKSTSTVLIVSSLAGFSFLLLEKPFWPAFILAAISQYVVFSGIASTLNQYLFYQTKQKELDKLENLSSLLSCATCNTPNIVTFLPDQNERVTFVCEKCESKNVVNISFTVARVTEFKDPMMPGSTIPRIS
jgi:hypothetical protein